MIRTATVESAIRFQLMQQNPCTLEALINRMPQFSWCQIFTAIDQLSRRGELVLRHPTRFDYEVSLNPIQSAARQVDLERRNADGVHGVQSH